MLVSVLELDEDVRVWGEGIITSSGFGLVPYIRYSRAEPLNPVTVFLALAKSKRLKRLSVLGLE